MKKILITGGAGYIGSSVCKYVSQKGYKTVVFDNLLRGHRKLAKWGTFIQGDLTNDKDTTKLFTKNKFHAVMHFAALSSVGESSVKPDLYYQNNVIATKKLLDNVVMHKIPYIIFSSSASVYGIAKTVPVTLAHPLSPINPYGRTKLVCEWMIQDYAKAYGFRYVILRYFNAAGADIDSDTGSWHTPETALIPVILEVATGERNSITIFGNDYNTVDGTGVRDYIHVYDLATAHLNALSYLENGGEACVLNLGTSRGYSVKQVIDTVRRITKKKIKVKVGERREGDPAEVIADNKMAKKTLKWKPKYHDIGEIIRSDWIWHEKLAKLKRDLK